MKEISNWVLTNHLYKLYYMKEEDFGQVSAFLNSCRNDLDRIEFFYPYTDDELRSVLKDGYFVGVFDKDKMIASFALDTDIAYAEELAGTVTTCTKQRLNLTYAYETSGLMVDKLYRKQGLASQLMALVEKIGQTLDGWLCGVVQLENIASMSTFLKNGFVLGGVNSKGGAYDFGYYVKPINNSEMPIVSLSDLKQVKFRDMQGHLDALANGFLGVKIESSCIIYAKQIKKIGDIYEQGRIYQRSRSECGCNKRNGS